MILPFAVAIAAIAALIMARQIYVSTIKVTEDKPAGIFFGLIAPVGGGIVIWVLVFSMIVSLFDAFIESGLSPEDFPYKEEIPIEDAVFSNSEGLLYYIALDGTYQSATEKDMYVSPSPDGEKHLVSMYRADPWLSSCEQYEMNILIPDAEEKTKRDAMEEVAQERLDSSRQEPYEVVPHFDDTSSTEETEQNNE